MTDKNKEFDKIKHERLMQWILGILTTYPNSPIDEMIKECETLVKVKLNQGILKNVS